MEEYPKPVSKLCTKIIFSQMNGAIYKIKIEQMEESKGIGFFCYINFKSKNIPVLITNTKIINEEYLENNNQIKISLNKGFKTIELCENKYINKEYDLSIIEIKDDKSLNFLELDDNLFNEEQNINAHYNKESIYIYQYKSKEDILVSYGTMNYLNKMNLFFSSNINKSSYISPIFNLSNNKLIGIYKNKGKFYHEGISFKFFINEFIKRYRFVKNMKNEIDILININKEEINKKIYFIDNKNIMHYYNDLEQLNSKLFINEKEFVFKNYFKPEKEGAYNLKIIFDNYLINCSYMFSECKNISEINFISFNSKKVTNMKYMFYKCENLRTTNLFCLNTKNVSNMSSMFEGCKNLKKLDLSSFNTGKVTDMSNMFYECNNLKNINLSSFDTKNVTDMSNMFYTCNNLYDLDLSSFDTCKVTNMTHMFYNTNNLNNLNISSFDTKNVIDMSCMFYDCSKLKNLDLSSFDTMKVTNIFGIFYSCNKKILNNCLYVFNRFDIDDLF